MFIPALCRKLDVPYCIVKVCSVIYLFDCSFYILSISNLIPCLSWSIILPTSTSKFLFYYFIWLSPKNFFRARLDWGVWFITKQPPALRLPLSKRQMKLHWTHWLIPLITTTKTALMKSARHGVARRWAWRQITNWLKWLASVLVRQLLCFIKSVYFMASLVVVLSQQMYPVNVQLQIKGQMLPLQFIVFIMIWTVKIMSQYQSTSSKAWLCLLRYLSQILQGKKFNHCSWA